MFTIFHPIIILQKIYPKKIIQNMEKGKQANEIAFNEYPPYVKADSLY